MGKRSDFKKRKQDKYYTPYAPAIPLLLPHLVGDKTFIEPCVGDGQIVKHLARHGHRCLSSSDISPEFEGAGVADATTIKTNGARVITNPPWTRVLLHKIIWNLSQQGETWLLFDSDWQYTVQDKIAKSHGVKQVPELLEYCELIVAVGRISWMGNGVSGMDNCAWYKFTPQKTRPIFVPKPKKQL